MRGGLQSGSQGEPKILAPGTRIGVEALKDVRSALAFHLETFGPDSLDVTPPVLEAFVAEAAASWTRVYLRAAALTGAISRR
jgi:hypothetical protein